MPPSLNHDIKKEKLKDAFLGLHWAAMTGNVGLIKFALDHGVPIESTVNGFVPLQLACVSDNNIAAVQYLIDRGADVNVQKWSKKHSIDKSQAVQGATGCTALHVACTNGCIKIVDLLIRNNARIDIKDKYGSSPMDIAQAKHEIEMYKLLKAARQKQLQENYQKPHEQVSNSSKGLKSKEAMTHKRTLSEKQQPRIRRPSLPSIFEAHFPHTVPSFMNLTPATAATTTTTTTDMLSPTSRRSFSMTHRPEEITTYTHSCPVTPRTSLEHFNKRRGRGEISPRSSEESSPYIYSTSPSQNIHFSFTQLAENLQQQTIRTTADGQPDWYSVGVIKSYEDDNYLLSLERRAYNLECSEHGELERRSYELPSRRSYEQSQRYSGDDSTNSSLFRSDSGDLSTGGSAHQLRTTALKNAMAAHNSTNSLLANESESPPLENEEEGYDGDDGGEEEDDDDDDDELNEPMPRPSVIVDSGPEADLVRYRFLHDEQHHRPQQQPHSAIELKKGWLNGLSSNRRHSTESTGRKSLDFRPSLDSITHFAKRNVPSLLNHTDDDSSNEEEKHQLGGFFSKWTTWYKKG
ncbi:uncharacterized protein BX663DRAFT_508639 [Cokeromyces recurvatus]|uniref:uncharacterized protein n=1 Tax=Cokeromyces recurvatus TaxID=90255 RepID=UPI00221F71EB|nr:uncharacterized protein BX663DRAFT_508639 [Cokeromyces recurvatus]KAI7902850.1 hypothetical protein BX663DRAFT_508639 [Cokeromyces recurvatus]